MLKSENCKPGQEQYEEYYSSAYRTGRGAKFVQYDYRTPEGKLFSTVARTLDHCRNRRDAWLERKEGRA